MARKEHTDKYEFNALSKELLIKITPLTVKIYENLQSYHYISEEGDGEDYASQLCALALVSAKLICRASGTQKSADFNMETFAYLVGNYYDEINKNNK